MDKQNLNRPAGMWRKDFPTTQGGYVARIRRGRVSNVMLAWWSGSNGWDEDVEEWLDESPEAISEARQNILIGDMRDLIDHYGFLSSAHEDNFREWFNKAKEDHKNCIAEYDYENIHMGFSAGIASQRDRVDRLTAQRDELFEIVKKVKNGTYIETDIDGVILSVEKGYT